MNDSTNIRVNGTINANVSDTTNVNPYDTTKIYRSFWDGQHEVKIDVINPFLGTIKVDYEYVYSEMFTTGISARYGFAEPKFIDGKRHHFLGFFRGYLPALTDGDNFKYPASGLYMNIVHLGYYKGYEYENGTFAIGQDIGWKSRMLFKGIFSLEISFGWGWAFYKDGIVLVEREENMMILPNYLRFGICLGMWFER